MNEKPDLVQCQIGFFYVLGTEGTGTLSLTLSLELQSNFQGQHLQAD